MITVAFRVEGGGEIGLGHVMRCLSLAREFSKRECRAIFISKMKDARICAEAAGMKLVDERELGSITNMPVGNMTAVEMELESNCINGIIKKYEINIFVLDSYNVSLEYMKLIQRQEAFFVYIDDLNSFDYPVDVVVNGNITAKFLDYPKLPGQRLLLGTEFNLIREEFRGIYPKKIEPSIKNIMLTTGGSDPYNCTQDILEKVLPYAIERGICINVVVGKAFPYEDDLNVFSTKYENVILHRNVTEMYKIMASCDLAISAGGSTLYELCACGVPALAFILADNQEFLVEKMDQIGYIGSLGWYDKIEKNMILEKLDYLNNEVAYRENLSRRMQGLVDGLGTERVVEAILNR